jgi:type III secretion protein Q
MDHVTQCVPAPLSLRRIDATALAKSRLTHPYRATCLLQSGEEAELLLRLDATAPARPDSALALSTRSGSAVAFDYGPLLLACSGVDMDSAADPSVRTALARYGFASLPPTLQAVLGEPSVCGTPPDAVMREPTVGLRLRLALPSIRLTMRLFIPALGLHAMLDSGVWRRVDTRASLPAWLRQAKAALPLLVGVTVLPLADYRALACGDVVRVEASRFDVTGRAIVPFAGRRLHLCWLDAQQSFEVQAMSDATAFPDAETDKSIAGAPSSIEPSAIPIRLSFSLGALSLTVGEVSAIAAGSLLPLDRGLPPHVTIEANGLPIGAGELVDLDGRLAVQITQWPHGDTRPKP